MKTTSRFGPLDTLTGHETKLIQSNNVFGPDKAFHFGIRHGRVVRIDDLFASRARESGI